MASSNSFTMRVAKLTITDRLVGYFSPRTALERVKARTLLQAYSGTGYTGGKKNRRATRNYLPEGGSADADLLEDFNVLRARSRDLARNVPIATGAIATNKTHTLGEGLKVRASCDGAFLGLSETDARAWNEAADREFALAEGTLDFTRVEVFSDLQDTVFGSELESGDVFVLRRFRRDNGDVYGTKVQVIESDRVCNPNYGMDTDTLKAGVEHNASGVPVAIHVADRHPGDLRRKPTSWRRVPIRYNDGRRIVIHLLNRQRPDQTRGVPYFAPVIEAIRAFGDYSDAEVRAAVVSAMFTVFVKSTASPGSDPLPTSTANADEVELGSGAVISLNPDESVDVANPGRPNPQFDAFAQAFLRLIGVALELPFEMLVKHFTASYSASRAALEMAYHTFRKRRGRFARQFCAEIRSWVIEEAIIANRLEAPGFFDDPAIRAAWLRAEWTGPVRISLDPKKDADADGIDLRNGVKTRQQIMTERTGGEFDMKVQTLKRENEMLADVGQGAAAETADEGTDAETLKEELDDA